MGGEILARLAERLVPHEPPQRSQRFAAVSIIVRDADFPSVLLIRRAERSGDPWSGQVAFPGGKMQAGDGTARDTAIRETMEEVGVDLSRADFMGYAPTATTHTGNMEVVPAVFVLRESVEVRPNEEVASYRWVDLEGLLSPGARSTYRLDYGARDVQLPAFRVDDYVVWGLTHRILSSVLEEQR